MLIYFILFLFGLIVGSFLNVIVYREVSDEAHSDKTGWKSWLPTWVTGRSYCDHCKTKLAWYENIPLLSFAIQQGRCRHCHRQINLANPFIELLTALEFVWIYWLIQRLSFFQQLEGLFSFLVLGFWIFVFTLSVILALIDLKKGVLPDSLVFTGIGVAVLRLTVTGRWEFLLSGLGLFLFFLILFLITQGKGIGFGDVKLAFFIGVVLGWWQWVVVAMVMAFLTGAVVGVILILTGRKQLKSAIPFGPFLLGGMLVAKVLGEYLWHSYLLSFH